MNELAWEAVPVLERPLVVLAYRGLFDAGNAATDAIEWLEQRRTSTRIARLDPEQFFDFQQERPQLRIRDGRREIDWPRNDWFAATSGGPHDLVVCAGIEPHLRWRTFCTNILEVVRRCDAEMVVTLGAMVGLVPHTRALPVTGSATNTELAARLGLGSPSYEGPTGVVGTLHDMLDVAGVPVISLRVTVPHYVPAAPSPKATRSLLRRFEQVTGVPTGHADMDEAAADWERQVTAVASDDPQVVGYVRRLEEQYDTDEPLPTGEDLAAELEAFLREQRGDDT
jgi:proteasome assembly chaperone (PAC2) family protein